MEANGRSQEELFEEAHKNSMELVARMDDMMLAVVKAQVTVESFMIELLNPTAGIQLATSSPPRRSRR